jgi:adenosylcobinamide kinase / adenosylcobinamide-phosphate guanylyltransferase
MSLILVTGGARAGKSTFALQLARQLGGDESVCYLATAEPGDDEMRARITAHRAARPAGWRTIEVPRGVGAALRSLTLPARQGVVLLDCLTLLVSNVLLAQPEPAGEEEVWPGVEAEINDLIGFGAQPAVTTLVVTNEVGLGIVPANRLARIYRDLLGRANQRLAAVATFVYLVVSGIPLEIKGIAHDPPNRHLPVACDAGLRSGDT